MKNFYFLLLIFLITKSNGQINSDPDPTFSFSALSANGNINSIIVQPDNKILVGGFILQSSNVKNLFRLNNNGTIDNTFNLPTVLQNIGTVHSIALQSDGKILVGVEIVTTASVPRLYRLNSDGSLDGTFNVGLGFNETPKAIALQSDGKILVGGTFTSVNGISKNRIIRLNLDGSVDASFNIGSGFNDDVLTIKVSPDGKILIGGDFNTYKGLAKKGLVRLNTDASIDNNFFIGVGPNNSVYSIYIQSDGKILVGGKFSLFNNNAAMCLARLTSTGNFDTTFNIGNGFYHSSSIGENQSVKAITVSGSNIFVGGHFEQIDNISKENFASLNMNGSIDANFNIGTGFLGSVTDEINNIPISVTCLTTQTDSKLLIGGNYKRYNSLNLNYIVRLFGNSLAVPSFLDSNISFYPNPASSVLYCFSNGLGYHYTICDISGKLLLTGDNNISGIDVSTLSKGMYIIETYFENSIYRTKFFKN